MRQRIVAFRRLQPHHREQLARDARVDYFEDLESVEDPDFRATLRQADGLIGAGLRIPESLLDEAPRLKAIATISVGYDHYPLEALTQRGILLCNTPDVLTETTADTGFALIMALEMGRIRGAGLDVFEQEPLSPESPLPHLPNVVALPHIGSATLETRDAMAQRAVNNLRQALRGERPGDLVNAAAWAGE